MEERNKALRLTLMTVFYGAFFVGSLLLENFVFHPPGPDGVSDSGANTIGWIVHVLAVASVVSMTRFWYEATKAWRRLQRDQEKRILSS